MSPLGVSVTTNELLQPGSGILAGTGTGFVVGRCDQGPPITGPAYVGCQSINDYILAFGARSTTSAQLYDWVDTFFQEGGRLLYVTRDTDNTATAATLTLNDAGSHPSVVVTALTGGLAGNSTNVAVTRGTAATFTATTATSTALTAISSMANIGIGTPITGTGVAANTYITAVNVGASSATLNNATTASASGVTITPATFTVSVQDSSANVESTHGPYSTTAPLLADTTSNLVAFSQSAGSGFTAYVPVASAAAALSGGTDASDLTDATAVSALANFPDTLGPGTVALANVKTAAGWVGLTAHGKAYNRWAPLDIPDNTSAATLIAAIGAEGVAANASYGAFFASSCTIPGTTPLTTRTVPASAVLAGLRARVAATGNDNQAPAGIKWTLRYVTGFTNTYNKADTTSLNAAGINTFQTPASGLGIPGLCLCGFSSPISPNVDPIYWQASAATERMALVYETQNILKNFLFESLDGQLLTITAAQGELQGMLARHWANKALYGATAPEAGQVVVGAPVNTTTTEQLGQLNANLNVRLSPFVQSANGAITSIPITVALPAAA